jgi:hypothetical protein
MSMGFMMLRGQKYVHTAEPLVPEPSAFAVEIAIETIKKIHKSPNTDQIPAELINARDRTIRSEIHKVILFGMRRNCLRSVRSRSLCLLIRGMTKQTAVINL